MKIEYRRIKDYIPVDVNKLRPNKSYDQLIQMRTHAIDGIVEEYGKIPDDFLSTRPCPTCKADDFKIEMEKDNMTLVRCKKCDLVYVNPVFNEDHYKKVYASKEYQQIVEALGHDSHEYRVSRFGSERIQIIETYLRLGKGVKPRYLDVGCSTGFIVEAAKNKGWHAIGIDLNPAAIAFGKKRGLDLRNQALETAGFAPDSFDVISFFDVLEHLVNPEEILDGALRLLKPGGLLFLYVPNYDCATRLLLGKNAHFIWPTHHLNYYNPETMTYLLEQLNMKVEMLVTEGLDIADYIWYKKEKEGKDVQSVEEILDTLQFLSNAGGYGVNLRALSRK